MILSKIKSIVSNPTILITKLKGFVRHLFHPSIDASAIIKKPLKLTPKYITLGENTFILNNARIEGVGYYAGQKYSPRIIIGKGSSIQQNLHLTCANLVEIGENCAITHNVTITDIDHTFEYDPANYPPLLVIH